MDDEFFENNPEVSHAHNFCKRRITHIEYTFIYKKEVLCSSESRENSVADF